MSLRNILSFIFFSLTFFMVSGCDVKIFDNKKHVLGDYYLEQWEDFQTYYIVDDRYNGPDQPAGAIDGVVREIGWDDRYIYVLRDAVIGADGWMKIDTEMRTITGPVIDIDSLHIPSSKSVEMWIAVNAWERL